MSHTSTSKISKVFQCVMKSLRRTLKRDSPIKGVRLFAQYLGAGCGETFGTLGGDGLGYGFGIDSHHGLLITTGGGLGGIVVGRSGLTITAGTVSVNVNSVYNSMGDGFGDGLGNFETSDSYPYALVLK